MSLKQEITELLTGSYTSRGIERWFERPRIWLNGKTPQEVLDSKDIKAIRLIKNHIKTYLR